MAWTKQSVAEEIIAIVSAYDNVFYFVPVEQFHCCINSIIKKIVFALNSFKKEVRKKIRYSKMQYKIEYGTDFMTTLEKYIKKACPAIIAMSTHHRSSVFDKLFYPSETKKMVYHTKVPLMVFHHKEKPIVSYYN